MRSSWFYLINILFSSLILLKESRTSSWVSSSSLSFPLMMELRLYSSTLNDSSFDTKVLIFSYILSHVLLASLSHNLNYQFRHFSPRLHFPTHSLSILTPHFNSSWKSTWSLYHRKGTWSAKKSDMFGMMVVCILLDAFFFCLHINLMRIFEKIIGQTFFSGCY